MAINFPAFFKDRRNLVLGQEATKILVLEVLTELEWEEIGLHPYALDYRTKGTILTPGERIYVNITDSEIILRSECMNLTQFLDFGKNKANISEFWLKYEKALLK